MADRIALFTEKGQTGIKRTGGYIYDEWLRQLEGDKGRKVFREMSDNDPTVGAGLFLIDAAIRRVKWFLEPRPEDDERSQLIWTAMHDMSFSWNDFISEVLTMLPFGWSFFETVYKRRRGAVESNPGSSSAYNDGKIGWRKFAIRLQDSLDEWDIDNKGGIRGMYQRPAPDYQKIYLPIQKALLFRTRVTGNNPEGRSLIRNAFIPWYRKKRIEEIEAIGIERDLAGIPVAWIPANFLRSDADADEKAVYAEFQNIVRNVRNDEQAGLIMPLDYDGSGNKRFDFSLLTTEGQRLFDTLAIRKNYDLQISQAMLTDIQQLGHEKVGSLALAINKYDLLQLGLGAIVDRITATFNRHAIPRLLMLNGMSIEEHPNLRNGSVETVEPEVWANAIQMLSGANYKVDDETTQQFIREKFGMPELSPEAIAEAEAEKEQKQKAAEALGNMNEQKEDEGEDEA